MLDSRLTNAYEDLRADLAALARIGNELDELFGQTSNSSVRRASNAVSSAIAALAIAVDEISDAAGECRHEAGGVTWCRRILGHGGKHSNGTISWDDDQAQAWGDAAVAGMGGRTE